MPEMKVAEIFLYLAWHGFILTLIFGKKRVAKIQEQIVIAEEIMGDTQTCVFFLFFFRQSSSLRRECPNVQNVIIAPLLHDW